MKAIKGANGIEKLNGYLISKGGGAAEDFAFLIQALSNDETRPMLNLIHIEQAGGKTICVTTDGSRLHKIEFPIEMADVPAGDYSVRSSVAGIILVPYEEGGEFPLWRKVIPENQKNHFKIVLAANASKKKASMSFSTSVFKISQTTGACINIKYLEDLISHNFSDTPWDIHFGDTKTPVVFIQGNRQAVIMPMSVEPVEVSNGESKPVEKTTNNRQIKKKKEKAA